MAGRTHYSRHSSVEQPCPADGVNFGRLLTDKANRLLANEVTLTALRPVSQDEGYDVGFNLQVLYGSDARYSKFLGELNHWPRSINQIAFPAANIVVHLPWLTRRGIDLQIGQQAKYPVPFGYDAEDPSLTVLYSHSYTYNFGLPPAHTGIFATTLIGVGSQLWLGIDSGGSDTFGPGNPNRIIAGLVGGVLHLPGSKFTVRAVTHVARDTPAGTLPRPGRSWRFENEMLVRLKLSEATTLATELNYIHFRGTGAEGYGAAQYIAHKLSGTVTLNVRAELWRDNAGSFVTAFPGVFSFTDAALGLPNDSFTRPPTTYGEVTVGLTYEPKLPGQFPVVRVRPEIRYDRSLNGTAPFAGGRKRDALTIASDVVFVF